MPYLAIRRRKLLELVEALGGMDVLVREDPQPHVGSSEWIEHAQHTVPQVLLAKVKNNRIVGLEDLGQPLGGMTKVFYTHFDGELVGTDREVRAFNPGICPAYSVDYIVLLRDKYGIWYLANQD